MNTNLIILGASGRMGSTLIRLAANSNDLTIAAAVEPKTRFVSNLPEHCVVAANLEDCIEKFPHAVIIDFTSTSCTMENAKLAARYKNPLVIGTTGLNAEEKKQLAEYAKQTPIMMSPNMSVGINVLLDILPKLTAMLGADYDTELMEIHHNLKKDAPSGTALRLATIAKALSAKDLQTKSAYKPCAEAMSSGCTPFTIWVRANVLKLRTMPIQGKISQAALCVPHAGLQNRKRENYTPCTMCSKDKQCGFTFIN